MGRRSTRLRKAALSALHFSGADGMIAPFTRGIGAIFKLHQVRPEKPAAFEPNRVLRITPTFLEQVIDQVRAAGFDIVSLDEAQFRLVEGEFQRPFCCFTFDGGYRDNLEHAYPIFRRRNLPFAIYVPTDYPDGQGELWWLALEAVIGASGEITVRMGGTARTLRCATPAEKDATYHTLYAWLRSIDEADARAIVRELAESVHFDMKAQCRALILGWDQLRQLGADPLVTIGAHTRRHFALARLPLAEARAEIESSLRRIERELGRPCRHFSFPFGDAAGVGEREFAMVRESGFKTAVTARRGLIHARHRDALACLPRVALDGDYQQARYIKVLLSGVPFAVGNMMRRVAPQAAAL